MVTQGAGTYKLALVKVYFCKNEDVTDEITSLKKAYCDQIAQAKSECDRIQREFVTLSNERSEAHVTWQKQCQNDRALIPQYKQAREEAMKSINFWLNFEKGLNAASDNLQNAGDAMAGQLTTLPPTEDASPHKDYSSELNDNEILQLLRQLEESKKLPAATSALFQKSLNDLNNAAQIENEKMDIQNGIEKQLEAKQDEFKHALESAQKIPSLIAKQSLILASNATLTTVTDEDGHYIVPNPRGFKNLIIVASSQREVNPGDTETYYWIMPITSDSEQSTNCDLNNSNELLTGEDGGKILQFPPFDASTYNYSIQPL